MVNRIQRWGVSLLVVLPGFLGLQGCSSRSVILVHPPSGASMRCSATGSGLMAGVAEGFVADCVKNYESKGYVLIDKLSPQERSDLEKRGLMPKEEPQ